METAIEVSGVKVSFGGHHVLCGVDCAVETGSIVTFLGRNGCGKSTQASLIADALEASGREVVRLLAEALTMHPIER